MVGSYYGLSELEVNMGSLQELKGKGGREILVGLGGGG